MAKNGVGFTESVVHAPDTRGAFRYRSTMGMIPSAEFVVFMDDFLKPVASNLAQGWTAAIIDTGATITVNTTAGDAGASGVLVVASDGTTEGAVNYGDKQIQLTSQKRFFMEVRAQTNLAATTDLQFGLSDLTATTNPEDLWTTTSDNLVAFGLLNGSAKPQMLADLSNSGSTAEAGTESVSDATWVTLAIFYDGNTLSGFVDGRLSLTWSQAVATTVPTGVAMAPFFGFRTGTAAGNTGLFDYIRYVIER